MTFLESEVNNVSPRDVASVFFRRIWQMLLVYVTILIATAAYCFFWPPTYEASARFLVKHDRDEPVLSASSNSVRMLNKQPVTEDELNSEMAILESPVVLERTVRETNLEKLPEHWLIRLINAPIKEISGIYNHYHSQKGADEMNRAVETLVQKLDVSPEKKSAVLEARIRWGNPAYAKELLEHISANYLEHHIEVHQIADTQRFFLDQANDKQRALAEVERRIEAIRPGATLGGSTYEKELWIKQANDFEAEWRRARALGAQEEARVEGTRRELQSQPDRITTEERPIVNQQALGTLKSQVLDLQLKKTELLRKYQPGNPLVAQIDQQLAQANAMLVTETQNTFNQKTTDVNKVAQSLQQDLALNRSGLRSTTALEAAMHKEYNAYKTRLDRFNSQSRTLDELERDRRSLEASLLQYRQQYESARVEDAMNSTRMLNVAMLEPVWVDPTPVKPNGLWIMKLALGAGLLLSIGWGFLIELLDHRIRSTRDLELHLKVPVLVAFDLYRGRALRAPSHG